ncbi:MAG: glycerophosphodiester phosphodiesterase [Bacteroidetes bacterium]|nr:glycerophosphodiester phosphodiesterase [Bacteroidota bacterium]
MIQIKHKPFYSLHPLRKNLASFAVKFFLLLSFASYSQNPIIIAHRGASAYAPENTISAFEKAIEMGAVIIETDVHQTKDSVVVIMHDLSLDKTTNGEGLIKDISSSDFKQLSIKLQKTVLKENPPTLEEAIIAINGRCKLLIELKKGNSYYPNIEKHIVDLIAKYNAQNWISTIHSFEKEPLINFAKRDSSINLQKLIVFNLPLVSFNFDKHFSKDDFKNWEGVNVYYKFCSKRVIKKIHKLGKTVYVWTVNKPRKARKLAKRGVDGIITNKPDILTLQ